MKKTKKVSNEELMKKLEELQKLVDKQPNIIQPIIQPIRIIPDGHGHCFCQQYNPIIYPNPWMQPSYYTSTINFKGGELI